MKPPPALLPLRNLTSSGLRSIAAIIIIAGALCLGMFGCSTIPPSKKEQLSLATATATDPPKQVNFALEFASDAARNKADWVINSGDNQNLPFAIVDKKNAKAFVFNASGQLRGAAPVLLGLARGNDTAPGIGSLPMSRILPAERTTPAGRFVAALDHNSKGKEILWVDYVNAISMHPVITSNPKERRVQRLATPSSDDNRISYGCINVPADFFEKIVRPTFTGTTGIVYVLSETLL